ncbi:MAG: flagellar hook-basal body complex protein FliE [Solirubrobacteraceae bacterium]|jgi:flagellar hook-basal body complex protein FliE|nr:flagellar hook-basal body complex protein FliE [Solirubrobacteraceae bacterium]
MTAIDPSFLTKGGDWGVGGVGSVRGEPGAVETDPAGATSGAGSAFGSMLTKQLESLQGLQDQASEASTALANGTATDPTTAVMAVERAQLSMQLASQLRTKGVEAINDVFHTQV